MNVLSARPRPRPNARQWAADETGLSLIEVMFTALIVVLLAAATATALIATARASADQQFRSEADSLAAQDQDNLRSLSDEQLNQLQAGTLHRQYPETLGKITYQVTSGASFQQSLGNSGCSATAATVFEITSTVTWTDNGQTQSVSENSLLSRPVVGDLTVQVDDSAGAALPGVSVTAAGASQGLSQQAATTNSSGCAFFAGLAPGTYPLSLSLQGYVDENGNSPSSSTVQVSSAGAPLDHLVLGRASGPINATFRTDVAGASAVADGLSWLLVTPTGMSASHPLSFSPASAGASSGQAPLFPGSYAVWGGRCSSQEPPSGSVSSVGVSPGQAASLQVTEPALYVGQVSYRTYNRRSGWQQTQVRPRDVVLTYQDHNTGCVDTWATSVAAGSGSTPPADGWLQYPGQPYAASGTLSVCIDYWNGSSWYQGSATTGNSVFSSSSTANQVSPAMFQSSSGCP